MKQLREVLGKEYEEIILVALRLIPYNREDVKDVEKVRTKIARIIREERKRLEGKSGKAALPGQTQFEKLVRIANDAKDSEECGKRIAKAFQRYRNKPFQIFNAYAHRYKIDWEMKFAIPTTSGSGEAKTRKALIAGLQERDDLIRSLRQDIGMLQHSNEELQQRIAELEKSESTLQAQLHREMNDLAAKEKVRIVKEEEKTTIIIYK